MYSTVHYTTTPRMFFVKAKKNKCQMCFSENLNTLYNLLFGYNVVVDMIILSFILDAFLQPTMKQ